MEQSLIRPNISGATIIYKRDNDGHIKSGLHIKAEEADKLYTSLDAGIISGNSVFKVVAIMSEEGKKLRKTLFVNMLAVEDIIFHTEDDDDLIDEK